MVNILLNLSNDDLLRNRDNYLKELCVHLKFFANSLYITDLKNALKTGKVCKTYIVSSQNCQSSFDFFFFNWLQRRDMKVSEFMQGLLAGNYNSAKTDLNISIREGKGIRTYSPFSEVKPIKIPSKWTIQHVWKAIIAGQISYGICNGVYTDDYAYDAASNFRQGEINVLNLAKKIIKSPSGWWVTATAPQNGNIKLSVNCGQFNYNTVFFEIEEETLVADQVAQ